MYSTSLHLLFSSDYVLILLLLFTDTAKLVLKSKCRDVGLIQGHSECHMFEAVPSCSGGKVLKKLPASSI